MRDMAMKKNKCTGGLPANEKIYREEFIELKPLAPENKHRVTHKRVFWKDIDSRP